MSRSLPNTPNPNFMSSSSFSSRSGKSAASMPMFPDAQQDHLVNFLNSKSVSSASSRRSNDSLLDANSVLSIQHTRTGSSRSNSRGRRLPEHIETFRPTPTPYFSQSISKSNSRPEPLSSISNSSSFRSSQGGHKNAGNSSSHNMKAEGVQHSTKSSGATSAQSRGSTTSPCLVQLSSESSSLPSHGYDVDANGGSKYASPATSASDPSPLQVLPSKSSERSHTYRVREASPTDTIPLHRPDSHRLATPAPDIQKNEYDNYTTRRSHHGSIQNTYRLREASPTDTIPPHLPTPAPDMQKNEFDNYTTRRSHHGSIQNNENRDCRNQQGSAMINKGSSSTQRQGDIQNRHFQADFSTLQDTTNTDSVSLNNYHEDNSTIPTNDTFDSTLTTKPDPYHDKRSNNSQKYFYPVPSAVHCLGGSSLKTYPIGNEKRIFMDNIHSSNSFHCGTVADHLSVHRDRNGIHYQQSIPNGVTQFAPYMYRKEQMNNIEGFTNSCNVRVGQQVNCEDHSENLHEFRKIVDNYRDGCDGRDHQGCTTGNESHIFTDHRNGNQLHVNHQGDPFVQMPVGQQQRRTMTPSEYSGNSGVYSMLSAPILYNRSSDTPQTVPCSLSASEPVFRERENNAVPPPRNLPFTYSSGHHPKMKNFRTDNPTIHSDNLSQMGSVMGRRGDGRDYTMSGNDISANNEGRRSQSKGGTEVDKYDKCRREGIKCPLSPDGDGSRKHLDAPTPIHRNIQQFHGNCQTGRSPILKEIREVLAMRQKAKDAGDHDEVDLLTRYLNLLNDELNRLEKANSSDVKMAEEEMNDKEDNLSSESSIVRESSPVEELNRNREEDDQRKINIRAPMNLKGGCEFSANIKGKLVTAIVPKDVVQGEIFSVEVPKKSKSSVVKKAPKSILKRKIKVRAPQDLKEGYEFTAIVKGKEIKSTIPKGGVKKGEIFSVPYIPDSS